MRILLLIIFLIGLVLPFIPALVILELFFLFIPFAFIFVFSFTYLIINLLRNKSSSHQAVFYFSILPFFILTQLASAFTVDRIQRFRSKAILQEIQKIKTETGHIPNQYDLSMGIEYRKGKDKSSFEIRYARGFMVAEKYTSKSNSWHSYGWNDGYLNRQV